LIPATYDIRYYREKADSLKLSGKLLKCEEWAFVMDKVQLLIIDEHEAVRKALATRLGSAPTIDVVATERYLKPDRWSEDRPVDVALFGLRSGSDLVLDTTIEAVKELTCRGTAVIVLTSYADDIERELLLQSGAYRYLLKNINSNQLIAEILEVTHEKTHPIA
jgi:DNA-binding NarL/FixJ family response regulator